MKTLTRLFSITLLWGCFANNAANAQSLAPVLGFNSSSVFVSDDGFFLDTESRSSFTLGVKADLFRSESFSLNPSLLYTGKGYEFSFFGLIDRVTARMNYIEVPLIFTFRKETSFVGTFLGVGPYVAYAASGKWKGGSSDGESLSFGSAETDDFKAFDAGLRLELGVEAPVYDKPLQFAAYVALGIADISTGAGSGSVRNRAFGFSVAYFLLHTNRE